MTGDTVIEAAGEEPTDWTLVVTADGEVAARRRVPFDGVLTLSTEIRRNRPRKRSEFGLGVDEVIARYRQRAATESSRAELTEAVARALKATRQEAADV